MLDLSAIWNKLPFTPSSSPVVSARASEEFESDQKRLTSRLVGYWQELYPRQDLLASLSDGRWYRVRMIEKFGQTALEVRLGQEPYVKASDTDFTSIAQLDTLAHAVCVVENQLHLLEEIMIADLMAQLQTVLGPARYAYQHDILALPDLHYRRSFSTPETTLAQALQHLSPVLS